MSYKAIATQFLGDYSTAPCTSGRKPFCLLDQAIRIPRLGAVSPYPGHSCMHSPLKDCYVVCICLAARMFLRSLKCWRLHAPGSLNQSQCQSLALSRHA